MSDERPNISSYYVLGFFFVWALALFMWSYLSPYDPDQFSIFLWILSAYGLVYTVYYGFLTTLDNALYIWFVMYFLFPHKQTHTEITNLLNVGMGATDVWFSLYQVINFFFVGALIISAFRNRKLISKGSVIPQGLLIILVALIFVSTLSFVYIPYLFGDAFEIKYWLMVFEYGRLVEGIVVLVVAFRVLGDRMKIERFFKVLLVASCLISLEFILAKYTNLLPDLLKYFILDFRGGYRSLWYGDSLFVTQILIFSIGGCIYFGMKENKKVYFFAASLFFFVITKTFQRGSMMSAMLMLLLLGSTFLKFRMRTVIASTLALVLTYNVVNSVYFDGRIVERLFSVIDTEGARDDYDDSSTLLARIGIQLRAFDCIVYSPIVGSGVGNLPDFMNSVRVPQVMKETGYDFNSQPDIESAYNIIAEGTHTTNPHNLIIFFTGELGIFGFIFSTYLYYYVIKLFISVRKAYIGSTGIGSARHAVLLRLTAVSILMGFLYYYVFQATPAILAILFILVRIALLEDPMTPVVA